MAANNVPKKREEEYTTNKVLVVFSLCLLGVLVLMGIKNMVNYGSSYLTGMMLIRVLIGVSALCVIIGIIKMIREKQSKISTAMRILTGKNIFIVSFVSLIVFTLTYKYLFLVFNIFYVSLPALAVYYLIFHSYQREFFVIAVDGGVAGVLLFIVRRAVASSQMKIAWAAVAIMAVILIVQAVIVAKIKSNDGKLKVGAKEYDFAFSKNAYTMMFLTPLVMTALVALGAATSVTIGFYAIIVVAAYLFVTAVYYTVKLM